MVADDRTLHPHLRVAHGMKRGREWLLRMRALPFGVAAVAIPVTIASAIFIAVPLAGAFAIDVPAIKRGSSSFVAAQAVPHVIHLPVTLDDIALDDPALGDGPLPVAPPTRTRRPRPTAGPTMTPAVPGPTVVPPTGVPSPTAIATADVPTAAPAPDEAITRFGRVRGTQRDGVRAFLGIPYAAPPVGEARWRLPSPPEAWAGVRDAVSFGAVCPQWEDDQLLGDEDCLTLNVWAPGQGEPAPDDPDTGAGGRPVMVWIHGGGHQQGSSAQRIGDLPLYDGQTLAARHGVVVVTINYRLGPFGFLAHPTLSAEGGVAQSGNYGMHDQLAALTWVRDNVAAFGGDPARVTIFGQSAGAVSVCRLVASPLATGLLAGAIMHSGGCPATPLARAEANGVAVASDVGCADAADTPACLRSRSTQVLMDTLAAIPGGGTETLGRNTYDGVIDGYAVPEAPQALIESGRHNAVPMMIGATSAENGASAPPIADEAAYEAAVRAYFARSGLPAALVERALDVYPVGNYATPRDAYVALTSDLKFACSARNDARRFTQAQDEPVFRFWFDHVPENAGPLARSRGAYHGADLPFLFDSIEFQGRLGRYVAGPADRAVIALLQRTWARFAATGDPNGAEPPGDPAGPDPLAWPVYELTREPALRIASPPSIVERVRGAECDFWSSLRP